MRFFSDQVMRRAERHALRFAKRFKKNEDGATAIEFAIVALPFFTLLFGIMELAIVFFVNSALVHATSEAGRHVRVGNFQACGGADQFKALVCENMKGLGSNSANNKWCFQYEWRRRYDRYQICFALPLGVAATADAFR